MREKVYLAVCGLDRNGKPGPREARPGEDLEWIAGIVRPNKI